MTQGASSSPPTPPLPRRLEHVDAMRPFSQAAVIGTHAMIFFAPFATSIAVTGALTLSRFSRESFFFISALVLTYTYVEPATMDIRHFWKRRLLLIGVPYVAWTVVYYLFTTAQRPSSFPYYRPSVHYDVSPSGLHDFVTLLFTGYYQLYFIIVLFQFYLLFPLLLKGLRRAQRWHVPILVLAALWQIFYDESIRNHFLFTNVGGKFETRMIISYAIYLLGGMIAALNYQAFHQWILNNSRAIVVYALTAALLAILLDLVRHVAFISRYVAPQGDVLAPMAILYNVGAILCLYLLAVVLVDRRRSVLTRWAVTSTADASFGIYLSQMLWLPILVRATRAHHLYSLTSWPVTVPLVLVVVFLLGYVLTIAANRSRWVTYVVGCSSNVRRVRRSPSLTGR